MTPLELERLSCLGDVPVEIEAAVAGSTIRVSELLALRVGSTISTALAAGTSIPIFAGGACIGDGELSGNARRAVMRMVRPGSRD